MMEESHYKNMCNDVRRLVAVYIISIPIERLLSGSEEPIADFTQDLLNDMLSILFYYETVYRFQYMRESGLPQTIIKNASMFCVNDYLTNRSINMQKLMGAIGMGLVFNMFGKYIKERHADKLPIVSKLEDSLQTIIVLSLANHSIYDAGAKAISLFLFHSLFKW